MKKFFTLLFVLVGCVGTTGAWDNVYLVSSENSWTNYNTTTNKFYRTDDNNFYIYLPPRLVTSSDFQFRFLVYSGSEQDLWGPASDENKTISTSDYYGGTNFDTWGDKNHSFSIPANAAYTGGVKLNLSYNNNSGSYTWHITITSLTATTTLAFVKPDSWTGVKAYWWDDDSKIRYSTNTFPGDVINEVNNVYSVSVATGAVTPKIIFSDSNNSENKTGDLTISEDKVYNKDGAVNNQTIAINQYGYGTYCSNYPLDFSDVSGLTAYRIDNVEDGVLSKQAVGKVPAKTGLFITGTPNKDDYSVPTTATATAIGTNLLKGVVSNTAITQTVASGTNYILTVSGSSTTATTPKFFKVNASGNTVLANRAYLQIPTGAGARESFWFDDETTGIAAVEKTDNTDNVENKVVYNLNGQRVMNPSKGLYIVNGKKVIIK